MALDCVRNAGLGHDIIMARFMYLFSFYIAGQDVATMASRVSLVPEEISYDESSSVHLTCQYNLGATGQHLFALIWEYSGENKGHMMFSYSTDTANTSGPSEEYRHRLTHHDVITDDSHTMQLNNVNFCDLGDYNCAAYPDKDNLSNVIWGNATLKARPGGTKFHINDENMFDDHIYYHASAGSIACTAFWYTADVEISIESHHFGNNSSTTEGQLSSDCTYQAGASLHYELQCGQKDTFLCEAKFPTGQSRVETRKVSVEKRNQQSTPLGSILLHTGTKHVLSDVVIVKELTGNISCTTFWNTSDITLRISTESQGVVINYEVRSTGCVFTATVTLQYNLHPQQYENFTCEAMYDSTMKAIERGQLISLMSPPSSSKGEKALLALITIPVAVMAVIGYICYRKWKENSREYVPFGTTASQSEMEELIIDLRPPSSPRHVVVEIKVGYVLISWEPPEDSGGSEVTGYLIQRKKEESEDWEMIGKVQEESFQDYNLNNVNMCNIHYRVTSENSAGQGGQKCGSIILSRLKKALKSYYSQEYAFIHFLPWIITDKCALSQLYVDLEWEHHFRLAANIEKIKLTHYSKMLLAFVKSFFVAYVWGDPGMGKTTFTKKFAFDWATGSHDIVNKLDLVVVITLRALKPEETIEELVCRELLKRSLDFKAKDVKQAIQESGEDCLLLCDGLDEMTFVPQNIKDIQNKTSDFNRNKVIFTSRPGGFYLRVHEDMTVVLQGFSQKSKERYIQQFFNNDESTFKSCLEEINQRGLTEMSKIPLLLHLLCILFKDTGKLPKTLTGVYIKLEKFIMKRYKVVLEEKNEDFNEEQLQSSMAKLQAVAFTAITSNQLIFEEDKIETDKMICDLGFMSLWPLPGDERNRCRLSFIHLSFMSYLAAAHVVKHMDALERLWRFCTMNNRLLSLRNMFSMCCGLAPEKGVELLKKVEELEPGFDLKEDLCRFQMQALCEIEKVMEESEDEYDSTVDMDKFVDISSLLCCREVYLTNKPFHVPGQVLFLPQKIVLRFICLKKLSNERMVVSQKEDNSSPKSCMMSVDKLQQMSLFDCELDKEACKSIYKTIFHSSQKRNNKVGIEKKKDISLQLWNCSVADCPMIWKCLQLPHVTVLDLKNIPLTGAVRPFNCHLSLTALYLDNCGLTGLDLKVVIKILTQSPSMKVLVLSGNDLCDSVEKAIEETQSQFKLQMLDLSHCCLTNWDMEGIAKIVGHCPELGELLIHNNDIKSKGLNPLYQSLKNAKHSVTVWMDIEKEEFKQWHQDLPQHNINPVENVTSA